MRIFYYDVIKAIAIFLVCYYHFNVSYTGFKEGFIYIPNFGYIVMVLASIGVPLFFLVNGALLLNKPFELKLHIKKIAKVYFILICWRFITVLSLLFKFENVDYKLTDFINLLFISHFPNIPLNHLWFMDALLSIYIIFPVLKFIYDSDNGNKIYQYMIGTLIIFSVVPYTFQIVTNIIEYKYSKTINLFYLFNNTNPFGTYAYSLLYFSIGGILGKLLNDKKLQLNIFVCIVIFVISWFLLAFWGAMYTKINGNYYDAVFGGYPTLMTLFMSICFFVLVSKIATSNSFMHKSVSIISANTLGIYYIHWIVGYLLLSNIKNLLSPLFVHGYFDYVIQNVVKTIILVLISLLITLMIKKTPLLRKLLSF